MIQLEFFFQFFELSSNTREIRWIFAAAYQPKWNLLVARTFRTSDYLTAALDVD